MAVSKHLRGGQPHLVMSLSASAQRNKSPRIALDAPGSPQLPTTNPHRSNPNDQRVMIFLQYPVEPTSFAPKDVDPPQRDPHHSWCWYSLIRHRVIRNDPFANVIPALPQSRPGGAALIEITATIVGSPCQHNTLAGVESIMPDGQHLRL